MTECNIQKNKEICSCTYQSCPRKGLCCECIQYHKKMGEFPGCLFSKEVEATYDRSIERFIKAYQ